MFHDVGMRRVCDGFVIRIIQPPAARSFYRLLPGQPHHCCFDTTNGKLLCVIFLHWLTVEGVRGASLCAMMWGGEEFAYKLLFVRPFDVSSVASTVSRRGNV